jgi:hypothetical protein
MKKLFTLAFVMLILLSLSTIPNASANRTTTGISTNINYLPVVYKSTNIPVYFIDSVNGSDTNSGTQPNIAWKSIRKLISAKLVPGTIVYLKRGSIWTERLSLSASGTTDSPITITTYGDGAAPILSYPSYTHNDDSVISLFGSHYIIDNIHIQQSMIGVDIFSDGNIIQNTEIDNVGYGVVIEGQYNLITRNYIHDTHMVHSDPGGDGDDYGADGIDIQGSHNEISFNRFVRCEAFSYDYGMSGGTIEIYDEGDYTSFHNNWSYQTENFVEISGGDPGSAQNVDIYYNVIINATRFTVIHDNQIQNFRVENNTLIDLRVHDTQIGRYIVFMGTPSTDTSYILRNNIIYLSNYWLVSYDEIIHENNLYYLPYGTQLGYPKGPGPNEIVNINPQFIDLNGLDFHLMPTSPAINAGTNLGYTQDFELNPVPAGNFPDLGALEYQGK